MAEDAVQTDNGVPDQEAGGFCPVDFVLAQEAWSNQEEKYAKAYQDAHRGACLDSNHRRDLGRSFGFERIRGDPLFDDSRSKESEIYYRSSVWVPVAKPVPLCLDAALLPCCPSVACCPSAVLPSAGPPPLNTMWALPLQSHFLRKPKGVVKPVPNAVSRVC